MANVNSADPDQTAPEGAVCPGFTLHLFLKNKQDLKN